MFLKRARNWLSLLALAAFAFPALLADAAEIPQDWELVIPIGVVEQAQIDPAPRINDLTDKTIVLRWNGKNNGDIFLDRIAEHLAKDYPKSTIIKSYTSDSSLNAITGNVSESARVAKALQAMSPDIIIAAQAD